MTSASSTSRRPSRATQPATTSLVPRRAHSASMLCFGVIPEDERDGMLQSDTGPRVDERRWLKAGVEYFDGRMRLSTVITLDYSSWAMASLPQAACEISLLVSRAGDWAEVRYAGAGG